MTGLRVAAVVGDGEVDLLLDGGGFIHQHLADRQPLDLHPQDLGGELLGLVRVLGQLDAAGLAAPADQHLRFDDNAATQFFGDCLGLGCGGRHPPLGDRYAILGKDLFGLIFVQFHVSFLVQARLQADYITRISANSRGQCALIRRCD